MVDIGEKMMCYRDRTFCQFYEECKVGDTCDRRLDDSVKDGAKKWWGSDDPPICTFVDKPICFHDKSL